MATPAQPSVSEGRSEPAASKVESKAESTEGAGATKSTGKVMAGVLYLLFLFSANSTYVFVCLFVSEAQLRPEIHSSGAHQGSQFGQVQS